MDKFKNLDKSSLHSDIESGFLKKTPKVIYLLLQAGESF